MAVFTAALLPAALTAVFGIFVFVAGQAIQRFMLEPIQEQRRLIGEIAYALLFYGNVNYGYQPGTVHTEDDFNLARIHLRKLAGQLLTTVNVIPLYWLLSFLQLVPSGRAVRSAATGLIGWSNSLSGDTDGPRKRVATALRIQHWND